MSSDFRPSDFVFLDLDPVQLVCNNIVRCTADCMGFFSPKLVLFTGSVKLRKI